MSSCSLLILRMSASSNQANGPKKTALCQTQGFFMQNEGPVTLTFDIVTATDLFLIKTAVRSIKSAGCFTITLYQQAAALPRILLDMFMQRCSIPVLHVEQEMHNIAVFNDILFSF